MATHKNKHKKCLLWSNICALNFHGSPAPQKYFDNKHFSNYGSLKMRTSSSSVRYPATLYIHVYIPFIFHDLN